MSIELHAADETLSQTPSLTHKTFIKFGKDVEIRRCTDLKCDCLGKCHCPFCDRTHFPASNPQQVQRHLEDTHWPTSVQYKGLLIVQCFQLCESETGGHYHCPECQQHVDRQSSFVSHLQSHLEAQKESTHQVYASDGKPPSLVYGGYTLRLCRENCPSDSDPGNKSDHYHCPSCNNIQTTMWSMATHLRCCLKVKNSSNVISVGKANLEDPMTAFTHWHKSVVRNIRDIPTRRCYSRLCCGRQYHCPLCPFDKTTPTSIQLLRIHFSHHVDNSVPHRGYLLLACHLNCVEFDVRNPKMHFHCPDCGVTKSSQSAMQSHLQSCGNGYRCDSNQGQKIGSEGEGHHSKSIAVDNRETSEESNYVEDKSFEGTAKMSCTNGNESHFNSSQGQRTVREDQGQQAENMVVNDGRDSSDEESDRVESNGVETRPEFFNPPISVFDKVTANVSSQFLRTFKFPSLSSAEEFFKDLAGATSVTFKSSPGTDPEQPVFNLQGSLDGILKSETYLERKFKESSKDRGLIVRMADRGPSPHRMDSAELTPLLEKGSKSQIGGQHCSSPTGRSALDRNKFGNEIPEKEKMDAVEGFENAKIIKANPHEASVQRSQCSNFSKEIQLSPSLISLLTGTKKSNTNSQIKQPVQLLPGININQVQQGILGTPDSETIRTAQSIQQVPGSKTNQIQQVIKGASGSETTQTQQPIQQPPGSKTNQRQQTIHQAAGSKTTQMQQPIQGTTRSDTIQTPQAIDLLLQGSKTTQMQLTIQEEKDSQTTQIQQPIQKETGSKTTQVLMVNQGTPARKTDLKQLPVQEVPGSERNPEQQQAQQASGSVTTQVQQPIQQLPGTVTYIIQPAQQTPGSKTTQIQELIHLTPGSKTIQTQQPIQLTVGSKTREGHQPIQQMPGSKAKQVEQGIRGPADSTTGLLQQPTQQASGIQTAQVQQPIQQLLDKVTYLVHQPAQQTPCSVTYQIQQPIQQVSGNQTTPAQQSVQQLPGRVTYLVHQAGQQTPDIKSNQVQQASASITTQIQKVIHGTTDSTTAQTQQPVHQAADDKHTQVQQPIQQLPDSVTCLIQQPAEQVPCSKTSPKQQIIQQTPSGVASLIKQPNRWVPISKPTEIPQAVQLMLDSKTERIHQIWLAPASNLKQFHALNLAKYPTDIGKTRDKQQDQMTLDSKCDRIQTASEHTENQQPSEETQVQSCQPINQPQSARVQHISENDQTELIGKALPQNQLVQNQETNISNQVTNQNISDCTLRQKAAVDWQAPRVKYPKLSRLLNMGNVNGSGKDVSSGGSEQPLVVNSESSTFREEDVTGRGSTKAVENLEVPGNVIGAKAGSPSPRENSISSPVRTVVTRSSANSTHQMAHSSPVTPNDVGKGVKRKPTDPDMSDGIVSPKRYLTRGRRIDTSMLVRTRKSNDSLDVTLLPKKYLTRGRSMDTSMLLRTRKSNDSLDNTFSPKRYVARGRSVDRSLLPNIGRAKDLKEEPVATTNPGKLKSNTGIPVSEKSGNGITNVGGSEEGNVEVEGKIQGNEMAGGDSEQVPSIARNDLEKESLALSSTSVLVKSKNSLTSTVGSEDRNVEVERKIQGSEREGDTQNGQRLEPVPSKTQKNGIFTVNTAETVQLTGAQISESAGNEKQQGFANSIPGSARLDMENAESHETTNAKTEFWLSKKTDTSVALGSAEQTSPHVSLSNSLSPNGEQKVADAARQQVPEQKLLIFMYQLPSDTGKPLVTSESDESHKASPHAVPVERLPDSLKRLFPPNTSVTLRMRSDTSVAPVQTRVEHISTPIRTNALFRPSNINQNRPVQRPEKRSASVIYAKDAIMNSLDVSGVRGHRAMNSVNVKKEPALKLPQLLQTQSMYVPGIKMGRSSAGGSWDLFVDRSSLNSRTMSALSLKKRRYHLALSPQTKKASVAARESAENLAPVLRTSLPRSVDDILNEIEAIEAEKNIKVLETQDGEGEILVKKQRSACPICENRSYSSSALYFHIMSSHTKYKCSFCLHTFTKKELLFEHMKDPNSHPSDDKALQEYLSREMASCGDCGKQFVTRRHLDIHQNKEHNFPIKCYLCHREFNERFKLHSHIETHHSIEGVSVCDICGKKFAVEKYMLCHRRRHNAEKKHACETCGRKFLDKTTLKDHLEVHKPAQERRYRYMCSFCGKRFLVKVNFDEHLHSHTGEKPYKCTICQKAFARRTNLSKHTVKHSDERPFQCEVCNKRFKRKLALKSHMVLHTGLSHFKCPYCNRAFGNGSSRNAHMPRCKVFKTTTDEKNLAAEQKGALNAPLTLSSVPGNGSTLDEDGTMQLVSENQESVELEFANVQEQSFVYMCSGCSSSFQDLAMAEAHINLCQATVTVDEN